MHCPEIGLALLATAPLHLTSVKIIIVGNLCCGLVLESAPNLAISWYYTFVPKLMLQGQFDCMSEISGHCSFDNTQVSHIIQYIRP